MRFLLNSITTSKKKKKKKKKKRDKRVRSSQNSPSSRSFCSFLFLCFLCFLLCFFWKVQASYDEYEEEEDFFSEKASDRNGKKDEEMRARTRMHAIELTNWGSDDWMQKLTSLGNKAKTLTLSQFETRMMSGHGSLFAAIIPEDLSEHCERKIREWYEMFRRVGRALDDAYDVVEVKMPGRSAQAIGETHGKLKKQEARKFACGVVGVHDRMSGSNLRILRGNYSDAGAYLELLGSGSSAGRTSLRGQGEIAKKFTGNDDEGGKHASCDWLAKPRREGDAKLRVAVFEPVDVDVFNFIATAIGGENVAKFARTSLFGCEVTLGHPVRESYGVALVADVDDSEDEFNEDVEIKVMPILSNKAGVFNPSLDKDSFIDFLDKVILANATSSFREMVDTNVDANCANDIWELLNNINDQYYEDQQSNPNVEEEEEGDREQQQFTPEVAWDALREPLLKALDGHGKGDKSLLPSQWMCGLAGSVAAFAEAKSELASANTFMSELMTLRKESIQLRTRNAVLERELAEMETRVPAGANAPGTMGLPKPKKRGFGAGPASSMTQDEEVKRAERVKVEEEEMLREQQQEAEEMRKKEQEEALRKIEQAATLRRKEEAEMMRKQQEAETLRKQQQEVEALRKQQQKVEEEEKVASMKRREEEAAMLKRQEEEALALRRKEEDEAEMIRKNVDDIYEAEDPELAFWTAHDQEGGPSYYYNSRTRKSTYEKPSGFGEPRKLKKNKIEPPPAAAAQALHGEL